MLPGGHIIEWYDSPTGLVSVNPDGSWHTVDPSLGEDVIGVALTIRASDGFNIASQFRGQVSLRPDSGAGEVATELVDFLQSTRNMEISLSEIIPLNVPGGTFDYFGHASHTSLTVELDGVVRAAAPGGIVPSFDIIRLDTTDGPLLSSGAASSWTEVDPAVLPDSCFAIIGSLRHSVGGGSGQETSYLHYRAGGTNKGKVQRMIGTNTTNLTAWSQAGIFAIDQGKFEYYRTKENATSQNAYVDLSASYALVWSRRGKGYSLDAWDPTCSQLVSSGTPSGWTVVTSVNGRPGDLVKLRINSLEGSAGSNFIHGVQVREITPNDDHQPLMISSQDQHDTAVQYARQGIAVVRLDENGQFEINRAEPTVAETVDIWELGFWRKN